MEFKIKEIFCYLLCCFCVNMVSGDVSLTASGSFTDNTYVVQTGSSVTLTCSNSDKSTSVTITDKDGTLGSCIVFLGAFTCTPSSYTVDVSNSSVNYFKYVLSSFQASNCGTYKCELAIVSSLPASSIDVEHEVYYDDPCGPTCGTCAVNTFECQTTTNKCVCKGATIPDPDNSTKCMATTTTPSPGSSDCKCDCCIHKIVWTVVSTLFSVPSLGWTLFVINDFRRRQWLTNNLGEQAHLCMIGWVVLNLVYSIIAAILFFVLVCKNDCCEEVCACICNCWPIYIIIGYVLKAGDVIVDIIGGIAFKEGCRCCAPCCSWCCGHSTAACYCCDRCRCCAPCCSWCCGLSTTACNCCDSDEDDDENPQHGKSNKKRGRTGAASNTVPMSRAHVHATQEPNETMDSHSSGSAVSRNDIYPHLNETASEKPLRQQPLPPVGGQKGHGRGLSANFGDNNDTMPAVDTKRLPPVMDRNEDTEVKKKKKKKKKNKEKREQD